MKPYYEHAGITIYHGDCCEVIGGLELRSDLLLTDPPYGLLAECGSAATRRSGGNDGRVGWDVAPNGSVLRLVMAAADIQMIWGGLHLELPPTFGYLVWDKQIDGLNFGECEVCWTSLRFAPRMFRHRAVNVDGGKIHPTQKPEALMRWCIMQVLNTPLAAYTVLDPFMGVGTTLLAAKRLRKMATGIEREERYCEIAAQRLSQEVLPLEMASV